jgi:large subunit ribosomal protein L4
LRHLAARQAPRGNHKVQTRNENSRTGQEDVQAEGHRRRPSRLAACAAVRGRQPRLGPVVRSHAFDLPKKVRAMACATRCPPRPRRHAGRARRRDVDTPKTAALRERFGTGLEQRLIIAGAEVDNNLKLAARNIPQVDVLPNAGLNVYDVLRRDTLVLTRDAIDAINARLGAVKPNSGRLRNGRHERHYDVILAPVITEKATLLSEQNKVVFRVSMDSTKDEIARAVESCSRCRCSRSTP